RVLATGIARLRTKIQYRPVVFELMPEEFTLGQLQACVEALADIGDEESIGHVLAFLRENRSERLKQVTSSAAARLGIFEAAGDIFPNLLAARTKTARRQFAISLANLLGKPDEFYQYVSGSGPVLQKRHQKL
ncbi:MAG TPA: hypothetical protein PK408_05600, partial [Treponemataceae bacterium]|nr:hypothetical protein [Treponemataceae bacterium]